MAQNNNTRPYDDNVDRIDNGGYAGRDSKLDRGADGYSERAASLNDLVAKEANNTIKYRTCTWQKTAALLFSEYICLAILSFPYSYSVLGLIPGLIITVAIALSVLYTSLIVSQYCIRHPELRDICDIGQKLFWGSPIAWYLTAASFLLNNVFIQGLHVLVGAKYLNTISNHAACTIAFSAITAFICFFASLPRTFDTLSFLATFSAFFTFVAVMLCIVFAGIEDHPFGYSASKGLTWTLFPVDNIPFAFITGMGGFLNISYTFIGQITIPSFIAEMKNPRDFPKALWAVTIAEIVIFSLAGSVIYVYTGNEYMSSPAFGSLQTHYKKIAFSFAIPTIIFLGVLYASVSARFIFFRIFHDSRHKSEHTLVGWSTWAAILAVTWVVAFIVAEVIPFFSDLLSLMSSLFDSFFGFIFWGVAWIRMRQEDYGPGWVSRLTLMKKLELLFNIFLICVGLFMLTAGTYSTVKGIQISYASGSVGGPFSCQSNGL